MEQTALKTIEKEALSLPAQAKAARVTDNKSLERAGEILVAVKGLRKLINETFDPIIKKAHESHREAIEQKKRAELPLVEAEGVLKPQIGRYVAEQERIKREAEEKARREEQARIEAERKAEEERLAAALKAEEAGDSARAEEILNEAPPEFKPLPPAPVGFVVPKISGMSTSTIWKFDVVDQAKIPSEFMVPNFTKIGQVVRATKGTLQIPGIRIYSEKSVSARGQ